ncbi:hypothetical protein DMC30DRAFT_435541 [Rhodotorula diobovata]|uniref:TRAF-type domain-containing protein n=1 Tax=Rhodotorula diobovata TaxID=5288 RepID=A0A5C5G4Y1_9BASI|nr:hypothetical protein DMC30DRAFT_435541 [Rhodotorula diobovata]
MLANPQPSRAATLKLKQYTFSCRHADAGCSWKGKVTKENEHATKLCRFRFLTCLACGEQYRAGFRNEHLDVCSGAIVVCPHGGRDCLGPRDSGTYARRDANKHANELCPNKPCGNLPFCRTRTTAANLLAHEAACIFQLREQGLMREQAAQQGVALAQAQQDKAALAQRVEALTSALKAADEAYEKERKRRRNLEDECADLLADLREERRRFAPLNGSGRAADEQRFAPPKPAWYRCSKDDCTWVGSVFEEATHDLQCPARPVKCERCLEWYPINRREKHDSECPAAPT